MAHALADAAWEACAVAPVRDRALESYARARWGLIHPPVQYFAAVPWVARATVDLHVEFGLLTELDHRTADLIALIVSQENSCRFRDSVQRASLWFQGMDRQRIERIERDLAGAELAPHTVAALEYARSQSRSGPAGAHGAWQRLRGAGVSATMAREIAFTVAINDFSNRLYTLPAIPPLPVERVPDRWFGPLLRPLLNRLLHSKRVAGRSGAAVAAAPGLPYGRLVAAYAGSPIAGALVRLFDDLWASTVLSARCKLLLFAVVSRGLPCEVCELELAPALQREGLDGAAVAHALARLDTPHLPLHERALLAFARETLWYEPVALQRRTRELRAQLDPAQLIETIGVCALANGLCRMAAVVMEDPA
jgi:alkylhydroperoxidase family enzyme